MLFMNGKDIYENFTNGTGPNGLSGGAAIVNEVAAGYGDHAEAIRRIGERMEAAWQGDAAGAARRGMGPLQVEHELAGMDHSDGRAPPALVNHRESLAAHGPERRGLLGWRLIAEQVEKAFRRVRFDVCVGWVEQLDDAVHCGI